MSVLKSIAKNVDIGQWKPAEMSSDIKFPKSDLVHGSYGQGKLGKVRDFKEVRQSHGKSGKTERVRKKSGNFKEVRESHGKSGKTERVRKKSGNFKEVRESHGKSGKTERVMKKSGNFKVPDCKKTKGRFLRSPNTPKFKFSGAPPWTPLGELTVLPIPHS